MLAQFDETPPSMLPPTYQGDTMSDMQVKAVEHLETPIHAKPKSALGAAQRVPVASEDWRIAKISQALDTLNKSVEKESNRNREGLVAAIMFEGLTSKYAKYKEQILTDIANITDQYPRSGNEILSKTERMISNEIVNVTAGTHGRGQSKTPRKKVNLITPTSW